MIVQRTTTFGPTLTDGLAMRKLLCPAASVTAFLMAISVCSEYANAADLMALTNTQLDNVTAGGPSAIGNGDAAAVGRASSSEVSVATGVATAGLIASAVGSAVSSASSMPTGAPATANSNLYLSITLP
jgi:hypothetical protein